MREYDPSDVDLPELSDGPLPRRPRIPLTRHRAAFIVVVGYTALAWGNKVLLSYGETIRGKDDLRAEQMALLFGVVMAAFCLKSLIKIYWPSKPPA